MANATVINSLGTMTGWSKVKTVLFGRTLVGVTKVSYKDDQEIENEYGAGRMPIGESEGNYKAEASLELTLEEMLTIQNAIPKGSRLQDIAAFDIGVSYEYNKIVYTDRLRNCRFMDRGIDTKQGDKTISTEFKLKLSHVEWNV